VKSGNVYLSGTKIEKRKLKTILSEHIPPRPGIFATVRNRHGMISAMEAFDPASRGRNHMVEVDYKDEQHPLNGKALCVVSCHSFLITSSECN
jgi:hypothetical protein